jgi:hypothetical protein
MGRVRTGGALEDSDCLLIGTLLPYFWARFTPRNPS